MNRYKLGSILDYIRSHGPLPKDEHGIVLEHHDLLVWFGLDQLLTLEEQRVIKYELRDIAEAEVFMDRLRSVNR